MVDIKKQIVSQDIEKEVTYRGENKCLYVTVHQTGNTSKGANAKVHANLQSNGNSRNASWHYTVDDKEAYQSFEDTAQCWHAGDGRGNGNLNSIGVEICINSDGDYKKSVENGAALVRHLLNKHGLSINRVRQHWDWSRKNCPAQIRAGKDGISWDDFLVMVEDSKGTNKVDKKPSKPAPKPSNTGDQNTNSIVDYLVSIKQDSSFANRKKLAAQHGISNYKGTPSQNTKLLNKLRSGSVPSSKPKLKPKAKNQIHLPASAKTWRTYKLNVQPVAKNSDWSLTPSAFGGLTYDILGEPYPNVVTINTSRGKRNIYVGPDTSAKRI